MRVTERNKESLFLIILLVLCMCLLIVYIIKTHTDLLLVLIAAAPSSIIILYTIGRFSKTFYIDNKGITVKWFGVIPIIYKWSEFECVQIETIVSLSINDNEEEAIICSKKHIIYSVDQSGDGRKVINFWRIETSPFSNVVIFLKYMNDSQLEEFWSYVPERLKR